MNVLKKRLITVFVCFFLCFALSIVAFSMHRSYRSKTVVVGAKNCTEGHLLSEMLAILAEEWTDLKVIRKYNLDSSICFSALRSEDIDVYVEYTGTALCQVLKEKEILSSKEGFDRVKEFFQEKFSIEWLDPLGFENAYALLIKKERARELNLHSLSDLASAKGIHIGFDQEFISREEYRILKNIYEMKLRKKPLLMDHALLYLSLEKDKIDVINGYSTDGFIKKYDLIELQDEQRCLPTYLASPVVRGMLLEIHPNLRKIFNLLSGKISKMQMQQLNFEIEIQGKSVHQVAYDFLKEIDLIRL